MSQQPDPLHPTPILFFNKNRVEAFSDGVFAMLLSRWNSTISVVFFFTVHLLYLLPSRFDFLWAIGHRHDSFSKGD